jgi:hypothetical protein
VRGQRRVAKPPAKINTCIGGRIEEGRKGRKVRKGRNEKGNRARGQNGKRERAARVFHLQV